jgi:hypothetical protein
VTVEMQSARARRRRRKRTRTGLVVCAVVCAALAFFEKPATVSRDTKAIRTAYAPFLATRPAVPRPEEAPPKRVVYPHSVIPGGVQNRGELSREMSRDPVIAAHFTDFRVAEARIVRVQQERLVHVSYRLGEKIFWTARRVRLRRGETLITDGRSYARTRCGNRVAVVPQSPVSPADPPDEVFDTPLPPPVPMPDLGEPRLSLEIPPMPALPLPIPADVAGHIGPTDWPLRYRVLDSTPPESFVEPPGVPEPGTFLLIGSGAAILLALRRSRKRR